MLEAGPETCAHGIKGTSQTTRSCRSELSVKAEAAWGGIPTCAYHQYKGFWRRIFLFYCPLLCVITTCSDIFFFFSLFCSKLGPWVKSTDVYF